VLSDRPAYVRRSKSEPMYEVASTYVFGRATPSSLYPSSVLGEYDANGCEDVGSIEWIRSFAGEACVRVSASIC
jgi:hypothetical protein